jgi:glutamate carboxypeptidase
MPRPLSHHQAFDPPPSQRQIPNQIKHFVPNKLILKTQRPILHAALAQNNRTLIRHPPDQPHIAQHRLIFLEAKRPRRRNPVRIVPRRQIPHKRLAPNRRRKINRVPYPIPTPRIHPDKLRSVAYLHLFQNPQILPLSPLRLQPNPPESLHIRQRTSIQDRYLEVIHLDDHVVHPIPDQRRKQVLRRLNQHALPHQARRITHLGHIPPRSRNLEVIQIRPPEHDSRTRRSRNQPHLHRRPTVQANATEGDLRPDCLLIVSRNAQGTLRGVAVQTNLQTAKHNCVRFTTLSHWFDHRRATCATIEPMPVPAKSILEAAACFTPWTLESLEALVKIESPSDNPAAINTAAAYVQHLAQPLDARPTLHKQKDFGDILQLDLGDPNDPRKPILLLGHLDTVWPLGTLATMPWRNAEGRLSGPGVLDMKAGIVMALAAVKVLQHLGSQRPVTLLLNSDEEIGSPASRPITERLALASEAVFVLEPAQGLAYKTARKGVGDYHLHVTGIAAHAGVDFDRGHSAIRELARLIETVSSLTDPTLNRTINCGRISGGTRSNVVPAEAHAEVDVRVATLPDADTVDTLFHSLRPTDPHCTLTVTGGINRPPMERTPGTIALFERAQTLAAQLGFPLEEASTGGGSDGNFTSALGIPTLDGMGAVGEGAHATHESILIQHITPRTALLAAMLAAT